MVKTKVETVLGPIDASELKKTLTHEHVVLDFEKHFHKPEKEADQKKAYCSFTLENINWIRHNPYSCFSNLFLVNETNAVIDDLKIFKQVGGSTIVENTSIGLGRDVRKMKQISEASGINIVCGTGYYLERQLDDCIKSYSVEQMTQNILSDINDGIDKTDIKPGIIGEVGCSWPLTDVEKRSLQAAAIAQDQSHTPTIIHPGRDPAAPHEIMRIFQEAGGDAKHTVMAHLDRTFLEKEDLLEFSKQGTYLEYDLFGIEVSYYQFAPHVDMPSDAQRINMIGHLISEGYGDRIVVAHDIHTVHRLTKYGGHGYSHILDYAVPKMLLKGISQDAIDKILVSNPKAWLTYC